MLNHFLNPISDAVHSSDPLQLILCLELFSNSLLFGHLLNQLKKHSLCLRIHFNQVTV